jgi:hypothetical protein
MSGRAGWCRLTAVLLATAGGCVSSYDPVIQQSIDRRVASLSETSQTFPAPAAPAPPPLAVGSWAQYKVVDEQGRPSFLTMKLVGEDLGSYWLEVTHESYLGRTLTKMLLYFGDRSSTAALDIKILRTKDRNGQVVEADGNQLVDARTRWQGLLSTLVVAWQGLPQEDTRVPAGTFSSCFLKETGPGWGLGGAASRIWSHPLVPLTGVVRAQGLDRPTTMELVAFGEHGAVSELQ